MTTTDIEIKLPNESVDKFRLLIDNYEMKEKQKNVVADDSSNVMYLIYTGISSIIFSYLGALLYETFHKSESQDNENLKVKLVSMNQEGEKTLILDNLSELKKLELDVDGAFLSIEVSEQKPDDNA